ncbi:MAG: putative metallopeptidase [Candidatus Micrarchaeota archaeon]
MKIEKAPDIQAMIESIVETLNAEIYEPQKHGRPEQKIESAHINQHRIICMRSYDSTARAYARIWAFPQMWQKALEISTFYVIEVLSQHFDDLAPEKKEQTLMHELLHIPKTFSGALLDHHHPSAPVNHSRTMKLWKEYRRKKEILQEQKAQMENFE